MSTIERDVDINREDLHHQLADRIAILVTVVSLVLAWWLLPWQPFPGGSFGLLIALALLGGCVLLANRRYTTLARHLLVWGPTLCLLVAIWLFPNPLLPFLGLPLVLVGATLVPGSEFAIAALVGGLTTWYVYSGERPYELLYLIPSLAFCVGLGFLAVRMLYTAVAWAWNTELRADYLLIETRESRAELAGTLHSLDKTNWMLRRTQQELVSARRQAEEARLMKELFAANVSHELRTPLNLILGFSEVMCLSPQVYGDLTWPPELRRDVHRIYQSSRHLLGMINDVLDLSRLEMVGFTLSRESTALEPLVRDAADIVEDLFRDRPISLELEIEPDLPMLELDRLRIRQVLLNLLNNAARFTQEGSVLVQAQHLDGEVTVSVSDTGPGIPADKMAHLFEEFYQVDHSLHRQHSGMGLGLAISKHFVEAHEGRIWVESEEGTGSTFTFTLPVPGEHTPVSGLSLGRAPDTGTAAMRRPIMVIDRDPMVSELVSRHLDGREVLQIDDVQQLEQQVLLHHPQAVILNVAPRDSETRGATLAVSVPLIECSLPSQTWVAHDLAVVGSLVKPITAERLLREVDRTGHVRRLLVVDDDLPFCQLVERMLEASKRDIRVRRAYSGTDALLALRTEQPDLMLLDLALPGMDGFQVLEQMRLDPQIADVPVLLVTATNLAEEAMKRQEAQILIRRPDGLGPAETLRCLRTVLNILEPRYDESTVPDPMSSSGGP